MYDKLVSYAAKQLELNPEDITPESTFESLGIDSLDIVEMIMDLESELGVELEIEDQKISTFQELADFIESKLNKESNSLVIGGPACNKVALVGELAVPCNLQSAIAGMNSYTRVSLNTVCSM